MLIDEFIERVKEDTFALGVLYGVITAHADPKDRKEFGDTLAPIWERIGIKQNNLPKPPYKKINIPLNYNVNFKVGNTDKTYKIEDIRVEDLGYKEFDKSLE